MFKIILLTGPEGLRSLHFESTQTIGSIHAPIYTSASPPALRTLPVGQSPLETPQTWNKHLFFWLSSSHAPSKLRFVAESTSIVPSYVHSLTRHARYPAGIPIFSLIQEDKLYSRVLSQNMDPLSRLPEISVGSRECRNGTKYLVMEKLYVADFLSDRSRGPAERLRKTAL